MKLRINITIMSIATATVVAAHLSCKREERTPDVAAASNAPRSAQPTDFIRTEQSFEASGDTQSLATDSGYLTVKFISRNEAVTVIAEPDSLDNFNGTTLGMIGSIRLENEDGNLVALDDEIEIDILLPNSSFESTETLRIVVENRDESGNVTESYAVIPTSFEAVDDETTKVTFTILGSYFTFGPVVLVNMGEEIAGYPEQDTTPEPTPTPTPTPAAAPFAPTGLSGNAVSSTQINLTWTDSSSNEVDFEIQRSTDNISYSALTTKTANSTSHSDTPVSSSSSYYYRIRACNAIGCSAYNTSAIINTPGNYQRVFVSSSSYSGNFGSVGNADGICQTIATGAALGGSWHAILSSTLENAIDHITISGEVRNMNGVKVADDATDFWDGSLDAAMDFTQAGNMAGGVGVWTGTTGLGTLSTSNCLDWTSGNMANVGATGYSSAVDGTWAGIAGPSCNDLGRLYCIDGQP